MDSVFWGIIPPILAITLALLTKDVIFSLFSSILAGSIIVAKGNIILAVVNISNIIVDKISDEWNIRIFLFCALLGAFVGLLSKAGAAKAFGRWAANFIKGRRSAQLWTWIFGLIIFIDDYFNTMSVGSVMRPVTDRNKVSRAKLAYILDSTAAPICILMPISSWVVAVMSYIRNSSGFSQLNINEMNFFVRLIPYNFYAILAVLLVFIIAVSGRDFGPMLTSEKRALKGELYDEEHYGKASKSVEEHEDASGARWFDMLIPIFILITTCIVAFPFTAVLPEAMPLTIMTAFQYADSSRALMYGVMGALIFTYIYFLLRNVLSIKIASEALIEGINSMVSALVILSLAWTIGHIISSPPEQLGLNLPAHLDALIKKSNFPLAVLPISVFVISCFISFATGTSWGTFGIMIPITLPLTISLAEANGFAGEELLNTALISVGAVLSGAVFGDHASPISATTVLSSAGANAPFIEHLTTQLPYAALSALCAGIGTLIAGLTLNPLLSFIIAFAVFITVFLLLSKNPLKKKRPANPVL
jgi:tetracycline resistance efflux pump